MLFSVGPFFCISVFEKNSVWFEHRLSPLLKISPFTYSPFFTKKQCVFLNCSFCAVSFFRKKLFLICWSSKESNVPLCFLFLLVSSLLKKKNLQNNLFLLVFEPSFLNHCRFFFV